MVHRIGVIPGDGIGPQVVEAALKVLRAAGVDFEEVRFDIGADRYARDRHVLDDADLQGIRSCDAILKGPLGPPIGDKVWMGMVSQAGVTLGLTLIIAGEYPTWGATVQTLVVSLIALHQLVGPVLFRAALARAGEIGKMDARPAE